MYQELLQPIFQFLQVRTPDAWIEKASQTENLSIVLRDHLLCELKAAQSALFLLRKYAVDADSRQQLLAWIKPYEALAYRHEGSLHTLQALPGLSKQLNVRTDVPYSQSLVDKMVMLIKEELHHFYQVLELMHSRRIPYQPVEAGRYAKGLLKHVKTYEPDALVDKLIIGAFIEARSCERFAALAPYMDEDIKKFYFSLLRSEARHYQDYLTLAQSISHSDITPRVDFFARIEAELICTPDHDFKFHSGLPV